MLSIKTNSSLKKLNTFGVDAVAKKLLCVDDKKIVSDWIELGAELLEPVVVLGEGSNVLFVGDFDGIVLLNKIQGCELIKEDVSSVWVKVGGGESWDKFVGKCVDVGWYGLENLSAIPGTVGAAPIQNIGAYGVELDSVFESLNAIDLYTAKTVEFSKEMCQFGYRESVFKHEYKDRFLITDVTFRLAKVFVPVLNYGDLKEYFPDAKPVVAHAMRETIARIRGEKLPDPSVIGNAGSFFKNPILTKKQFNQLVFEFPAVVHYPQADGKVKVAAAWLIDQCGLKGYRRGDAGVHDKQALVLVNYGGASGKELMELAAHIVKQVYKKFLLTLQIEPRILSV